MFGLQPIRRVATRAAAALRGALAPAGAGAVRGLLADMTRSRWKHQLKTAARQQWSAEYGRAWHGPQEKEADWLAGCLLIPHDAAHAAAQSGHTDDEVAEAFGVSNALAAWRLKATGARIRAQRPGRVRQRW